MDYLKKTIPQLKRICKERNIKGVSGKNKQALIDRILQFTNESPNVVSLGITQNEHAIVQEPNLTGETHTKVEIREDTYTKELLKDQYNIHKSYVNGRIDTTKKIGISVRLPCIPEDISENIIKFVIHNHLDDKTSRWDCKKGDLLSTKEGIQECKCFTSDGPLSFTPSSEWDVIYFLDARSWLTDLFILYRIPLKRSSPEWKSIRVNKSQTFEDQSKQGRRPRITWESLYPQINAYCSKVYEGSFDNIFTPLQEATV